MTTLANRTTTYSRRRTRRNLRIYLRLLAILAVEVGRTTLD
jgi:hypothetical protein